MDAAAKGDTDVAICDTSGRLHNNWRLMEELARCKAAIKKRLPDAPHEVLLVLDGTNGEPSCRLKLPPSPLPFSLPFLGAQLPSGLPY